MLVEPKLERPVLIQGLPGLGYVGKIAVNYLVDELKPLRFAELYSTYLILADGSTGIQIKEDGTYFLPKLEFYAYNQDKPNIIFLTGDTQPSTTGQYEVAANVLDLAQKYGCGRIIAVGGFQTPVEREVGQVYAVSNRPDLWDEFEEMGVNMTRSGAITGACGVILGLADQRKLDSVGLLGATRGEYPDMHAAKGTVQVLSRMLGLKVDLKKMDKEIEEMRSKLESLRRIQAEAYRQVKKEMEKRPFYV